MAENIRIGKSNHVPISTLSSSVAVTSLNALDNVKNEFRARVAKWNNTDTLQIDGNIGEDVSANYAAIVRHNLPAGATAKYEFYSNSNQTGVKVYETSVSGEAVDTLIPLGIWRAGIDPYGGAAVQAYPVPVIWNFENIQLRSWRLILSGMGSAYDPQIGMLALGETILLSRNMRRGNSLRLFTNGEIAQSAAGGHLYRVDPVESRVMTVSGNLISEADRLNIEQQKIDVQSEPFLVQGYPGSTNPYQARHSFMARYRDQGPIAHSLHIYHSANFTFVEA